MALPSARRVLPRSPAASAFDCARSVSSQALASPCRAFATLRMSTGHSVAAHPLLYRLSYLALLKRRSSPAIHGATTMASMTPGPAFLAGRSPCCVRPLDERSWLTHGTPFSPAGPASPRSCFGVRLRAKRCFASACLTLQGVRRAAIVH